MPEIKHTFAGGKMNKDLDERLVPNGEYRHAENIQVRTTDGDSDGVGDSGAVQNLQGNKSLGETAFNEQSYVDPPTGPNQSKVVGSVADEKNNKAYFFVAGPDMNQALINPSAITSVKYFYDTIFEVNTGDGSTNPTTDIIANDYWGIIAPKASIVNVDTISESTSFQQIPLVSSTPSIRVGMEIKAHSSSGAIVFDSIIQNVESSIITLYSSQSIQTWDDVAFFSFKHSDRFLNFDQNRKINAINVIDDILMWVDGKINERTGKLEGSEPKKINIKRARAGSSNNTTHTELRLTDPKDNNVLINYISDSEVSLSPSVNNDLKQEHTTLIKKAPRYAPTLEMKNTDRDGETEVFGLSYDFYGVADAADIEFENGYELTITSDLFTPNSEFMLLEATAPNWLENDILIFTEQISLSEQIATVKATVNSFDPELGVLNITIISFTSNLQAQNTEINGSGIWDISLEQRKPLFELKMARFGCRYIYEDGEYSSFSPWSELAFLPGKFSYNHKKGYNLGMVNTLRGLKIKNFIPHQRTRCAEVVGVDILYKTTESPNCYIVKTIKRGISPEWDLLTTSSPEIQPSDDWDGTQNNDPRKWLFGELKITSEMIHKAVDSQQLLRAWDNVPRFALAQEIAANRVMFSNYTQGYNITDPVGLLVSHNFDETATEFDPKKSIKTIRNYKLGIVFGDRYGRETPVIANGHLKGDAVNDPVMLAGDVTIDKQFSSMRNYFELTQDWTSVDSSGVPDQWMEYAKYYVKETSNEYYNLVMDRWYAAEDGNVWLSFVSADRNKIDEETYLVLKNEHGSSNPVVQQARYKVIAIENDAPNDIKTEGRMMGRVQIKESDYGRVFAGLAPDPNALAPYKLMTETELQLDTDSWDGFLDSYIPKGDLKIRIVGVNGTTELDSRIYKTVTYFGKTEDGHGILRWDSEFGEFADMLDRMTNAGVTPTALTYFIEFKETVVVENKSEFDGKFFVKIEKDAVLQSKVMLVTNQNVDYDNTGAYLLSYIDSQTDNPSEWDNGPRSNYEWFTDSGQEAAVEEDDDGFSIGNIEAGNIAPVNANDWPGNNAGANSWTNQQGANFMALGCDAGFDIDPGYDSAIGNFLENVPLVELFTGDDNESLALAQYEYLNNVVNFGRPTRSFWEWIKGPAETNNKARIFIDSCRLKYGKLTGPQQGGSLNSEGNGIQASPHYYKPSGLDPGIQDGEGFGPTPDNELGRIFISAHTVDGPNGDGQDLWGFAPSNEAAFKEHMTTPGAMFRFAADEGNHVYMCVGDVDRLEKANSANYSKLLDTNDPGGNDFISEGAEWNTDQNTLVNTLFDGSPFSGPEDGQYSVLNGLSFGGQPFADGADCDRCVEGDFCRREGFRVEFRRINLETGELFDNGTKGIDTAEFDPRGLVCHDGREALVIITVGSNITGGDTVVPIANAAVWETEPKEDVGLDIYYEASNAIPMRLTKENTPYFAPYKSKVSLKDENLNNATLSTLYQNHHVSHIGYNDNRSIIAIKSTYIQDFNFLTQTSLHNLSLSTTGPDMPIGSHLVFEHPNGTKTMSKITGFATPLNGVDPNDFSETVFRVNASTNATTNAPTGYYEIDSDVYKYMVELSWHNCYSFGNGVESDRIRDDFNAPQIDNGVKVSSTFLDYGREEKSSTIIYSGIYNSISGVNSLNEFNMAEKITKDLNPSYGSIQALKTRDTDVVVLAQDKVLKVTTNKDALFNADGSSQLIASNRVLGTAVPFAGDYGISNNPESLTSDQYRMYFTDKQRGSVLRLSGNGITPISSVGMKTWFRENLKQTDSLLGTFDTVNGEYNLTLNYKSNINKDDTTISFNEASKGWVSFKSFVPNEGVSVGGKYLTSNKSKAYHHYTDEVNRNTFYETYKESNIDVLFNDGPGNVKTFKNVNYEGSQAKVLQFTSVEGATQPNDESFTVTTDGEYYNLSAKSGWYVSSIKTDQSSIGEVSEFIEKEGKWFNRINGGDRTEITDQDLREFSVQGLGMATSVVDNTNTDIDNDDISDINIQAIGDDIDDPTNTID